MRSARRHSILARVRLTRSLAAFVVPALLLTLPPRTACAAPSKAQQGIAAFDEGEYERALPLLQQAAAEADAKKSAPKERAKLHAYVGFCQIVFSLRDQAKESFRKALAADPRMTLDPAVVSPKFIAVFDEVRREKPPPPPRKLPGPGRAALQSALLPGWGQYSSERKGRAAVFAGAAVVTVGTLVFTQVQASAASSYVSDARPAQKGEMKEQAARFGTYRNLAAGGVVLVWSAAAADAYRIRRPVRRAPIATVAPLGDDGALLVVAGSF